jgi:biopolymer transport protein TolQ
MAGARVASLSQRIDKVLDVTIQREGERLESKLLVLSTIASAARSSACSARCGAS